MSQTSQLVSNPFLNGHRCTLASCFWIPSVTRIVPNVVRVVIIVSYLKWLIVPLAAASITGTLPGTFINPQPPSPLSVITGIGTSSMTFGIPCDGVSNCATSPGGPTPPNSISYTPIPFSTDIGVLFVFGTITFLNGTIQPGTQITQTTLQLDLQSFATLVFSPSATRTLDIINTPNSGSPVDNADFLSIVGGPLGTSNFHVLESESASATLIGTFVNAGSNQAAFTVVGFGTPTGNGFTSGVNLADTPEPGTFILLACGLVLCAAKMGRSVSKPPRLARARDQGF